MKRILILLTFLNIAALCYSQSSCFNSYIDDANKEIKKQTEKGYKEAIRLLKECNYVCKDKPSTGLEQIKSMIKNCEDELNCFVSKIKEVDSLIEISKYETALYILENIDCNIRPNHYSIIIDNKKSICKNGIARQEIEKIEEKIASRTKVDVKEEEESERVIFTEVEQTSEFPGGLAKLNEFLASNIKYPAQAREKGTHGIVYVTFVVEKDGSITDIKVLRGIGSGCDEEALRVIKMMPKWEPAKHKGKAVRQQFNLPIRFILP